MNNLKNKNRILSIIRWTARIWGIAYLAFFLFMFVAEVLSPEQGSNPMTSREMVSLVFVFGYFAGLVLAWKWEGLGGVIAIGSTIAFSLGGVTTLLFVFMITPGLLFLMYWFLSRGQLETGETE